MKKSNAPETFSVRTPLEVAAVKLKKELAQGASYLFGALCFIILTLLVANLVSSLGPIAHTIVYALGTLCVFTALYAADGYIKSAIKAMIDYDVVKHETRR